MDELERLRRLYEVSKLLAGFEGVEATVGAVLAVASGPLDLRSVVLIVELDGAARLFAWTAPDASPARLRRLERLAFTSYVYLTGLGASGPEWPDSRATVGALPARARAAEPGGAEDEGAFLLPLVVGRRRAFGVLQLDPACKGEPCLVFASALANQLAVAIQRDAAFRREVAARARAEAERARAEETAERSRALAEALREAEERHRIALAATGAGTWSYDPATRAITCDARFKEILGLSPDAAVDADTWLAAVHPEDRARVAEGWHRAVGPGGRAEHASEYRVIALDDPVERVVVAHGRTLHDAAGRCVRLAGTLLDVTEQRRAEEARRRSEERFASIVSLAADAIVSVDEDLRITLFNEAAEALFGYARAEVLGRPLDVLLPERAKRTHGAEVGRFAGSPVATRLMGAGREVVGRRKDGHEFPLEASISKVRTGGRWVLTAMLRDVTEQRRVEREQRLFIEAGVVFGRSLDPRETLASVAQLATRSFADLCVIDLDAPGPGGARWAAAVHADPSKQPEADALAALLLDPRRPHVAASVWRDQRAELRPELSEGALGSLAADDEQERVLRALGPTSLIAVPLLVRGALVGATAFFSTRAERRYDARDVPTAEELAHRAALAIDNARLHEAARRALQARDDVLGVVAHDLRNPLEAIALSAHLLEHRAASRDPACLAPVERIQRSVRRMNRLIEDLLDVARIEAGRLSLRTESLRAARLVADAADALGPTVAAASLELVVDVPDDLPHVVADRDRILQVFTNLVGNAVKFTPAGGRVVLGAESRDDAEVRFRVADTGAGIPAEQLGHLFERFWQSSSGDRRGAGLGLTIAKCIVEAHGGRIWAESAPGHGTTLFFSLPAESEPASRPLPAAA